MAITFKKNDMEITCEASELAAVVAVLNRIESEPPAKKRTRAARRPLPSEVYINNEQYTVTETRWYDLWCNLYKKLHDKNPSAFKSAIIRHDLNKFTSDPQYTSARVVIGGTAINTHDSSEGNWRNVCNVAASMGINIHTKSADTI
jgi:hypothetical protein